MTRSPLPVVLCAAALLAGPPLPLPAQSSVTWSGQIRPRHEYRDPSGAGRDAFTSMRARVRALADAGRGLSLTFEIQDVRLWGEEASTLGDFRADALDVHQAFLRWTPADAPWLSATVGRQETSLGGQRLVGAVDWTQQGRAFDGVRLDLGTGARISLLAHTLGEGTAPAHDHDADLWGAYGVIPGVGDGSLDLYVLHDRDGAAAPTRRTTFGSRWVVDAAGPFFGRVEASLQRGEAAGVDVSAWMAAARLGARFAEGRGSAALWYDHLSGDEPGSAGAGAFNTLFATNHKFYGFADVFLDVPRDTGGRGLQDLAAKLTWALGEATSLGADLHAFWPAEGEGLPSGRFAEELDLTVRHGLSARLVLTGGLSAVRAGDAVAAVRRLAGDLWFGYLMLDATF